MPGERSRYFSFIVKEVVAEPMFLLLGAACIIYFLLQEAAEGLLMLAAIVIVSAISIDQEARSAKALWH